MFQAVLNAVLVCHHRRTTFPVTSGRTAAALRRTYIVCLDCGAELAYDWKHMRVVPSGALTNGARLLESRGSSRRCTSPVSLDSKAPTQATVRQAALTIAAPEAALHAGENAYGASGEKQQCEPNPTRASQSGACEDEIALPEHLKPVAERASPWSSGGTSVQPAIRPMSAQPWLPADAARAADRSGAAAGSGQYVVRAKLRMQQVQVALRVLNALMTGIAAQPDDVAKLRSWAEPGQQACSTRDLAQRVVACAVSL
jgi:hypothetical protein